MGEYKECDGLKYIMEQRLEKGEDHQIPTDLKDCIDKFKQIEKILNEKYHKDVNLGPALKSGDLLTDHGSDHVQMVMERAKQIIGKKHEDLTVYEIFILLLAIHFHDIGNIYGREGHEQKISEVMDDMGKQLPLDDADKKYIKIIAMAHGGYADENNTDKDTIRTLLPETTRSSVKIRPSLLAAILRFADELADDFSRAFNGKIVPPHNEIYHAYSKVLELSIRENTAIFKYNIPYEYTQKKMKKGEEKRYLYDEILDRLQKCLSELDYCRKYSGDYIGITVLSVSIYVTKNNTKDKLIDSFRLRLLGYPHGLKLSSFIERYEQDGSLMPNQGLNYPSGKDLRKKCKEA